MGESKETSKVTLILWAERACKATCYDVEQRNWVSGRHCELEFGRSNCLASGSFYVKEK